MPKGLHAILQYTSESEKAKKKAIIRKVGIRSVNRRQRDNTMAKRK
jgi:hypothetical protein